jgi:prepilin-type N-terminal cleavage/methylation domain-containing protein
MFSPDQRSLSEKIIVATIVFVVFLIVPFCVGLFYYNASAALKQQISSQLESEESLAVSAIQVKLNRLTGIASSLAGSSQVVAAATAGKWDNAASAVRDAENNVSFYDPYIDRFVFFDQNGTEQAAYPVLTGGIGANASTSDWFKTAIQGNPVVSSVVKRSATPVLNVINVAAPIFNGNTILGVLSIQVPANNFLDFGYALSTGTYGFTYVVDQKGNVVAHPKYPEVGITNLASSAPVKEILAGQSGTMVTTDPSDGENNFLVYSTIPKYNWGIVIQEPYNEVFSAYNSMMYNMECAVLLLLAIDLLLSYLIFRYVGSKRRMATASTPRREGFTLIELLVVIAIIAILSIVVVLTINPAEMIRQSRDSQRVADLSTLRSALSLYLVDSTNPNLASSTLGYGGCYLSATGNNGTTSPKCGVFANTYTNVTTTIALYRKNDSTGWIPVQFSQITLGNPLSSLPVDPVNSLSYYYAYAASSTGGTYYFELNAFMESKKYGQGGSNDMTTNDGGDNPAVLEVGSKPGLNL